MVVCFLTVPKEYTEPRENELDHSFLTELKVHFRYRIYSNKRPTSN